MFKISFSSESMKRPRPQQIEQLASASEMDLRYEYFETDVSLTVKGFGTEEFPGTPAIDFIFCILIAASDVRKGNIGKVTFTENDMVVQFAPSGLDVSVVRSWDSLHGLCEIGEFFSGAIEFCGELLQCIVQNFPAFRRNPAHSKLVGMLADLR
ncbi:hypothetical protein [Streptomyces ziwulingensis]|uniref:Uncharacterized protein n=1 Tax=Streptomyces ziwulingensis TaxID=1045501 RepID=A0ABP9D4U9_9ACTN